MKKSLFIILLFFTYYSKAQTKLINHKSHSGTNKTFNPHKVEGNFGLFPIKTEILKNKISKYSLIKKMGPTMHGQVLYILHKKNDLKDINTVFKSIISISNVDSDTVFNKKIETLLIEKLKKYREIEKIKD